MSLFNELKHRKVFRVGIAYAIAAWLVAQVAELAADSFSAPEWFMKMLLIVLLIGLPVSMVLAFAFELTADGIKRDSEVDPGNRTSGRLINKVVVGLLVVALGYFVWESRFRDGSAEPEAEPAVAASDTANLQVQPATDDKSIAVLPFENFSGDQADQYFADGLADTLLHKLAQISDLKVIARNSSFQFKGTNRDIREIGRILGANTILEGSVQRAGDQVRIIAQLINTADGVHLWSQSFDDSMDNIFALQDQIASEIVTLLQVSLSKEEQDRLLRNGTDNPEAYDLLMLANNARWNIDEMVDVDDKTWEPLLLMQQVVELDPHYAVAWAYLSRLYNGLAFATDSANDFDRFASQSRSAAEEALRLDPSLAEAHVSMGWMEHRYREPLKAARHFRLALELNPNNEGAMSGLGLQIARSDPEEALRLFTRGHEIDPKQNIFYRQKHFALMALGRVDEAIQQMELAVEAAPDSGLFYNDLSDLLIGRQGRPDEAARQLSRLLQLTPISFEGTNGMVNAWTEATDDSRASAWMDLLLMDRDDSDSAKLLNAKRFLAAGRFEEVLQQLDEVHENQQNAWRIVMLGLTANLGLGESARAAEYAVHFRAINNELKARGAVRPDRDVFVNALEMLSKEQSQANPNMKDLSGPLANMGGMPYFQDAYYLLAGIQARMGNMDEAMKQLERALKKSNGGVFNIDLIGFNVEQSPLLDPLRHEPAFENWLLRYRERRDAMLQRMIEMESRGEIVKPATIRRMTVQ
jgi:TolB-like protein/Tfp pilus assembly protein PilF